MTTDHSVPAPEIFIDAGELRSYVKLGIFLGVPFFAAGFYAIVLFFFRWWEGVLTQNQIHKFLFLPIVIQLMFYSVWMSMWTAGNLLSSVETTNAKLTIILCNGQHFSLDSHELIAATVTKISFKIPPTGNSALRSIKIQGRTIILKEEWVPRLLEIAQRKSLS